MFRLIVLYNKIFVDFLKHLMFHFQVVTMKIIVIILLFLVLNVYSEQCSPDGLKSIALTACKTYEVCTNSISKKYNCPINSIFDQRTLRCKADFICPETETCKNSLDYPDPNYPKSRYYIRCHKINSVFIVSYLQCGTNEIFEPFRNRCTTTNYPIPTENCEEEGVFGLYHYDCTTYMVCKQIDSQFDKKMYRCPIGSYFDPWKKLCAVGYECMESKCKKENDKGLDVNDPTKTQYYKCVYDATGKLIPLYLSCGSNQVFHETLQKCQSK
nr:uncharacterized protein LOC111413307 [Onthophagus taurus]